MSSVSLGGNSASTHSDRVLLQSLRAQYRRSDNAHGCRRRLFALEALLSGERAEVAAAGANVSVRTLRRWLATARAHGARALSSLDSELLPRLGDGARQRLMAELRDSPAAAGLAAEEWGGGALARHLKSRYQIVISVRQCRRLLRRLGIGGRDCARKAAAPVEHPTVLATRLRSDRQIKRDSLKRIQRLASSGLPLHQFLSSVLELIEEAVASGPNQAFLPGPNHSMASPRLIARGFDPPWEAFIRYGPETAGPEIGGMIRPPGPLSPLRPVLRHHEVTLPHFYRSAGYNEVFRKLRQHHALSFGWVENGTADFRATLWRSEQMKPFSEEDAQFAAAIAAHVGHGIRVAQALDAADPKAAGFSRMSGRPGMVYLDRQGRVRGMDARAEQILRILGAFDACGSAFLSRDGRALAFADIAEKLRRIFQQRGDGGPQTAAPYELIQFSNNGAIARASGVALADAGGPSGFGIILELGQSAELARRRTQYRWGLSPRHAQIVELMAGPDTLVESARKLGITPGTMRSHVRAIMERLELKRIAGLRSFAREQIAG